MQLYNCCVRPGGEMMHEVPKNDVSAAEILLLRGIHGEDAVINIRPSRVSSGKKNIHEYNELLTKYEDKDVIRVFGPGLNAMLPERLSDVGIEVEGDFEAEQPSKRRNGKRAKSDATDVTQVAGAIE